jgi:RNA-directed DNA polymerase
MGQFSNTDAGIPQGGVISPTLANFTLNGLEKVVNNSILPITKSKAQRYVIRNKYGERK